MESFGNEIKVQQGETWTLDKLISASSREYIPFIVSSAIENPYFIVTVASTKYEKNYRYVKSWWNSVKDSHIPTFYLTEPVFLGNYTTIDDVPTTPPEGDSHDTRYLYQYTLDYVETEITNDTVGVFYWYEEGVGWHKVIFGGDNSYDENIQYYSKEDIDKDTGHKPYYYRYYTYSDTEPYAFIEYVDGYECRLIQTFRDIDTVEWNGQNYLYQITLCGGETMGDWLDSIYTQFKPDDWPVIIPDMDSEQQSIMRKAQYEYVKVNYPDLIQPDIDADSPLGNIDTPITILPPTHIEVFNNLRKLI